jgi:phytoene dehydrogenase-like protein
MYDTIIIGQDLSSLIAALAASSHGLKTVLITEGIGETEHRDEGYSFSIDPMPLSGFADRQTVFCLLRKLNLRTEAPKMLLMDPALQVILPGHRVDLFHDARKLINDMIREFPQERHEIKRLYRAFFKSAALIERWVSQDDAGRADFFMKVLRRVARFPAAASGCYSLAISENGNDRALKQVIQAQIAILSHLDTDSRLLPLSAAYLLSSPARGIFCPLGGRTAWTQWLRKEYANAGGILMDGCSVMRIDTKSEIIVDLEHAGSSTTLHGKTLVVSAHWEKLKLLLFHSKVFRSLVHRLSSNHPNAYPFCLHLGVHEEGLPERMAPYVAVILDDKMPVCYHNLVFIEKSLQGDTSRAPEGRRAVSATIFLKNSPLLIDDSELKSISKTVINSLESFLPFLRENIDYVNIDKSIAFARQSQEIVNKKYQSRKSSIIAMNTLPPVTPLSNVFLTGGILRAGLGFEGEILTGMDAAFLVEKELKGDGP